MCTLITVNGSSWELCVHAHPPTCAFRRRAYAFRRSGSPLLPAERIVLRARTLGVPNFWGHGIVNNITDSVRLAIGDVAPAFSLEDDAGNTVSLGDFAGERVIVYFYPRANTPGCTKEACDFRDSLGQLNGLDLKVVGISPDSPGKLAKFREDHELNFPLLSDPEKSTMRAWGAFGEKKNYGKVVQGVIRSTFIVGTDGKIEQAFYNVRATGHVARILRDLE